MVKPSVAKPSVAKSSVAKSNAANRLPLTPARLAAIGLQASDLPKSWKVTPTDSTASSSASQPDPQKDETDRKLAACVGWKPAWITGESKSPKFSLFAAKLGSTVQSFRSGADLDADLAAYADQKVVACVRQVGRADLIRVLPPGVRLSTFDLVARPNTGDWPATVKTIVTTDATLEANGKRVAVQSMLVVARTPSLEIALEASINDAPMPLLTVQAALAAITARAAHG